MVTTDRFVDLAEEGYDVVVRIVGDPSPNVVARKLAPGQPQDLRDSGLFRAPRRAADARTTSRSTTVSPTPISIRRTRGGCAGPEGDISVRASGNLRLNDDDALSEAVLGGLGIALLPTFIIGKDIQAGPLAVGAVRLCAARAPHLRRLSREPAPFGEGPGVHRLLPGTYRTRAVLGSRRGCRDFVSQHRAPAKPRHVIEHPARAAVCRQRRGHAAAGERAQRGSVARRRDRARRRWSSPRASIPTSASAAWCARASSGCPRTASISRCAWTAMRGCSRCSSPASAFSSSLYARYYMSPQDPVPRFFSFLLAFMGSMLGVVLSGNLIQIVFFWELTSLFSFLLIGYWHHNAAARDGARMALDRHVRRRPVPVRRRADPRPHRRQLRSRSRARFRRRSFGRTSCTSRRSC